MTFSDIFTSSFLDNISSVTLLDMGMALLLAFGLGLFIFLVYQKTFSGVMCSSSFGVALIAIAMITTVVILAVTSNVVLSLGMVGALSIVRFRTAIKEPLDIVFLFWSIAVGIVLAAGMIPLAVIGSVFIGLMLLVFVNRKSHWNPYIVILRCSSAEGERTARTFLEHQVRRCVVKSKTVRLGEVELTMEVRLLDGDTEFISQLYLCGASHEPDHRTVFAGGVRQAGIHAAHCQPGAYAGGAPAGARLSGCQNGQTRKRPSDLTGTGRIAAGIMVPDIE